MKGWFRQGWRHALAARGISSYRTMYGGRATRRSFAPLITNEEIAMLQKQNGNLGNMSDDELRSQVSQLRNNDKKPYNPKPIPQKVVDKVKVDYLEPFRSPEDKSDLGKEMAERVIADKVTWADRYMTDRNLDFEDKRRIMDHYVNPLAEKLRKGHMTEREFNQMVDEKVKYNADAGKRDASGNRTLGAFSWAEEKPLFDWKKPEQPKDDGGPGQLNFIDKAKMEGGSNASE